MTLPDLDELLLVGPDLTDDTTREAWAITDDDLAGWALRKLAACQTERDRIRHQASKRIAEVEDWAAAAERAVTHDLDFFEGRLIDYFRRLEAADPKLKTYRLPDGTLVRRAGREKRVVTDTDAFSGWALRECPDAVAIRPLTSALPKTLITIDGHLVDPETGETVPGVEVVRGDDTYGVRPRDTSGDPF